MFAVNGINVFYIRIGGSILSNNKELEVVSLLTYCRYDNNAIILINTLTEILCSDIL